MPNQLATEQSPYLLQHKDNPVEWYAWGEAAFARARAEDKPIFLSIGYSTCHWCHVMEHESFESVDVAEVLNRHFVSIKVDREERPDVDRVYMSFVQATTGSGGWPMSVWLTPALQPFYGGTYFPPTSRWGRPGFADILLEIARVWQVERAKVVRSASTIVERLRAVRADGAGAEPPPAETLDRAVAAFRDAFDPVHGGFGSAPKFPRPSELVLLMREYARTGRPEPAHMAVATLRAMARGGMCDHLGGGFHRYSVDGEWRVPHFEKMLYDQAQLALAYVEASLVTGDTWGLDVARDVLDYVRRDLTGAEGGFHSAEDADSVPPERAHEAGPRKTEGAFYIWSDAEIGEALGSDAGVFRLRYGVRPDGNAPSDPQGEFTGRNILYVARGVDEVAGEVGRPVGDVERALARARDTLMARRTARPRPHLDDKVLTAWNGLTIAAFARAGRRPAAGASDRLPGEGGYLETARRAAAFVRRHLWDAATRTLRRRFRNGEAGVEGYAEDYAYLIFGLLELFQADGDPSWLEWTMRLQETLDARFWDAGGGGWFSTTGADPSVLLRLKEDHDGAEPAASSIAVHNLLTLSHLVGSSTNASGSGAYAEKVARTLGAFTTRATELPRALPMMLAALSTYHAGVAQIVIAAGAGPEDAEAMLGLASASHLPNAVTVPVWPRHRAALARLLPWVEHLEPKGGRATAYICRAFTCETPATSLEALGEQLAALRPHRDRSALEFPGFQ